VFDTNILVDFLDGVDGAHREMAIASDHRISIVTWMEMLVGARTLQREQEMRKFLDRFTTIDLTPGICERAVMIRRSRRLKLPDAIILATAEELDCLLVTRNTKDFPAGDPRVRVPYTL
jgi:hypothetical protein